MRTDRPVGRGVLGLLRWPVVTAVLVVGLVLGGTGLLTAGVHGDRLRYVALGDSYTAGPAIPDQLPDPPGCRRSYRNYPHVAAAALGLDLRDVSCSGATTADLLHPQAVPGGTHQPQLDALDPSVGVVTVGIGGNDIGFGQLVQDCVALAPLGRPCQDRFVGRGGDEISRRVVEVAPRVRAVLSEIRRRAPSARVYVVGYPAILPEHGPGCWPLMPFAPQDVPYLRDKEEELNAMLAAQAAATGAAYVDTYGPSLGRDACALPGIRWVEPVVPLAPAASVHPNALGMSGIADVVVGAVDGRDAAAGEPPPEPAAVLRVELEPGPG